MNTISTFLEHFDLTQLISLLIQAIAALLCISFHEMLIKSKMKLDKMLQDF